MVVAEVLVVLAIILGSLVIHENAHAIVALRLGDPTAQQQGRITLNPIAHLDIVGSLILPLFLFVATGSAFGYAKPVPVNRFMLRNGDRGFAIVALAGPVSNMLIAIVAAFVLRLTGPGPLGVVLRVIQLNVLLAAFNLIPIPPLDGSRLIRPFVGRGGVQLLDRIEPYGFLLLFALLYLVRPPYFPFDLIGWFVQNISGLLIRLLPL
ncbi:MAG TPA: site-2 protease family protein [Actinomycetota bacterium]|nr:site-2 protease family protein [Actinomycetota bacterium]